ncbi:MAG TPA: hypothetical protein VGD73_18085 [Pseudonocardia sp.]|uniref:hypothetical protein n=1 Tax=Pseudonocardia sp. TaxID=60912 RepID=UPI002EDA29C3
MSQSRRLVRYLSGPAVVLFVLGPALTPIGPVTAVSAGTVSAGALPAASAPALVDHELTVGQPPVRVDAGGFAVGTAPRPASARARKGR